MCFFAILYIMYKKYLPFCGCKGTKKIFNICKQKKKNDIHFVDNGPLVYSPMTVATNWRPPP